MDKTSFSYAQYPCITRSCSTYQIIKGLFMTGTFRIGILLSCCKTNQLLYSNFWHKLNYFLNGYLCSQLAMKKKNLHSSYWAPFSPISRKYLVIAQLVVDRKGTWPNAEWFGYFYNNPAKYLAEYLSVKYTVSRRIGSPGV